jgi:hypothetical protein
MKRTAIAAAAVCTFLGLALAFPTTARADSDDKGGTITFVGGIGITNPCNGESVGGPLKVSLAVATDDDKHHQSALIHVRMSEEDLPGATGGLYDLHESDSASFTAISVTGHYTLPVMVDIDGDKAGSPSFLLLSDLAVYVDANQKPTAAVFLPGGTTICDKK